MTQSWRNDLSDAFVKARDSFTGGAVDWFNQPSEPPASTNPVTVTNSDKVQAITSSQFFVPALIVGGLIAFFYLARR